MIRKYGKERGTQKFDEYREKQAYSNSYQFKKQKHGWTREQYDEFNKSRAVSLQLSIKRHGIEKGTKIFNDYCQKQAYVGVKLQYFIEKHGKEKGTKIYKQICKQKLHTLENFINRHGEILGKQKYEEYWEGRFSNGPHSKISQQLFNKIQDNFEIERTKYFTYPMCKNGNKMQFFVYDKDGGFLIDFYDFKTKKGIQFYGSYWHADPLYYKKDEIMEFPNDRRILVQDIWKKDKQRINEILSSDEVKEILIVWQNQFRSNPEKVINRCIDFLKQEDSNEQVR